MSAMAPAASGTTIRIGRDGQSCARLGAGAAANAAPHNSSVRRSSMRFPSDLASDQSIDRPPSAAVHEEMKHHDRPEQRIFDAARFPVVSVFPMMGDDRDDHENDDRAGGEAREKSGGQQQAADKLQDSNDPGPHQSVLKAAVFEEAPRAFDS